MHQIIYVLKYIKYYFSSKNEHGVHSPFVFELYEDVINSQDEYYKFTEIEKTRAEMLASKDRVEVTDLGAGSRISKSGKRKISAIAKNAVKSPQCGQLLFRLVNHFKPRQIIELGTSLGITTSYLAAVSGETKVTTFEGCPNISEIAQSNFRNYENIELLTGNFDDRLPEKLSQLQTIDFAFIDGNHQLKPTLKYFELLLQKADNHSVFVFDDIHWSAEMEQAWEIIKANERVTVTIDLFELGLVFFRKEQAKQNFVLRF